jgi:hypothetical protein
MLIDSTDAKLLYFLNLGLTNIEIAFGAGIFVNVDKSHGMRADDNPNSTRFGRLTLDDVRNKVPVKKDLFVFCAAGKQQPIKILKVLPLLSPQVCSVHSCCSCESR